MYVNENLGYLMLRTNLVNVSFCSGAVLCYEPASDITYSLIIIRVQINLFDINRLLPCICIKDAYINWTVEVSEYFL